MGRKQDGVAQKHSLHSFTRFPNLQTAHPSCVFRIQAQGKWVKQAKMALRREIIDGPQSPQRNYEEKQSVPSTRGGEFT